MLQRSTVCEGSVEEQSDFAYMVDDLAAVAKLRNFKDTENLFITC
jgi:hypothetical protein